MRHYNTQRAHSWLGYWLPAPEALVWLEPQLHQVLELEHYRQCAAVASALQQGVLWRCTPKFTDGHDHSEAQAFLGLVRLRKKHGLPDPPNPWAKPNPITGKPIVPADFDAMLEEQVAKQERRDRLNDRDAA